MARKRDVILEMLETKMTHAKDAQKRWYDRLKRAFNAHDKARNAVRRIERAIEKHLAAKVKPETATES